MKPMIFSLPGNEGLADALAGRLGGERGKAIVRRFPDGESYARIESSVEGRAVILCCTLDRPDEKVLPLLFLAATAKDLGAARAGLVAPYLAYMRQDRRFEPGEGITSVYFARLLSGTVDWLVTVDPHLHRRASLSEIYPIPTRVIHAAPLISRWIRENIASPVLIGPDSESAQWVSEIAAVAGAPYLVLEKIRRGDREVEVSVPETDRWRSYTPVLVDDIISTGRTMIETVGHLRRAGLAKPVCIGIHAIFADRAEEDLREAGASRVVTCNTIPHPSNGIDLGDLLAEEVRNVEGAA
ncbi:MAG: ribose-phosphate pyrophosphokinase [Candidatus Manganitrophaceae bacterium]|nr:MAG: ribose-phosphate pyrophosphokinase [Candidatus Manganitrophaceae bacterium]